MLDKREIVIKDACVLFDLVDLGLLDYFFNLELNAFTTAQVIGEITNEKQYEAIDTYLKNGKLKIDSNGILDEITKINRNYAGLSLTDSSVLELAIRKEAIVYTSDGGLRKATVKEGMEVRGILWIIEELFKMTLLSQEEAISKLKAYESINQRAPINEIKKLLIKIENYDS